jgi:hypothetical protein
MTDSHPGRSRPLSQGLLGAIAVLGILLALMAQPAIASVASSSEQSAGSPSVVAHGQAGAAVSTVVFAQQVPAEPAGAIQPAEGGQPPASGAAIAPAVSDSGPAGPDSTAPAPAPASDTGKAASTLQADGASATDQTGPASAQRGLNPSPEASATRPSVKRPDGSSVEPASSARAAGAGSSAISDSQSRADSPLRRHGDERASSQRTGAFAGSISLAALLGNDTAATSRQAPAPQADRPSRRQAGAAASERRVPSQPMTPGGDGDGRSSSGHGTGSAASGQSICGEAPPSALLPTPVVCILRPTSGTAWQLLRDRRGQPHPD